MKMAVHTYNGPETMSRVMVQRRSAAMRKGSDAEIVRAMKNAKASLQIEGITVSDSDDTLVLSRLKGEITQEEFLRKAREAALNVR